MLELAGEKLSNVQVLKIQRSKRKRAQRAGEDAVMSSGNLKMTLKDVWAKANKWLRAHKLSSGAYYHPEVDEQGLMNPEGGSAETSPEQPAHEGTSKSEVLVKAVRPTVKQESIEKLQEGFNKLIEQLQGINSHLNQQVAQHEVLMSQIEQLPKLLGSFPVVVENQRQMTEQLIEQLKSAAVRNQQFMEALDKIPAETAKQTDALVNIDHQLAAAAESDVQMVESFNKFRETLARFDRTSAAQTEGVVQMSKTFATSDRYLKYLMSRQNKRFMWMFIVALGVCTAAILALTGIIIYLVKRNY